MCRLKLIVEITYAKHVKSALDSDACYALTLQVDHWENCFYCGDFFFAFKVCKQKGLGTTSVGFSGKIFRSHSSAGTVLSSLHICSHWMPMTCCVDLGESRDPLISRTSRGPQGYETVEGFGK